MTTTTARVAPGLKAEQARISNDIRSIEERLAAIQAHLSESREVPGLAMRFATNCGGAYRPAGDKTRRPLNQAVVRRIEVRDGRIASVEYQEPFDVLFGASEFEYGVLVEKTVSYSNLAELSEQVKSLACRPAAM
jgi:hypothetical protein